MAAVPSSRRGRTCSLSIHRISLGTPRQDVYIAAPQLGRNSGGRPLGIGQGFRADRQQSLTLVGFGHRPPVTLKSVGDLRQGFLIGLQANAHRAGNRLAS